ncbi:uncharacterized protein KY384_005719 [Bacidia gigantensis]|uniref:uncharacterized protein n=1 Tax=Bacidia gigantensis TaxID=2732470 RepID=UPI001D03A072|nr:uncharacterized protein KY384_005719 [Bacidia gigantensis]KAG8529084.1 hypothetical protein KY384_005719 [Bacidia gigantensis]
MDDEILAPLEEVITMASRSSANERTTNDKASVDLGHHSVASLNLSNDTATSTTSDSPSERPPERFLEDKWHSRWRDDFQRDFKAIQAFQEWYDWREKSVGRIWLRKLLCYFTFQSPPKRPQIEHLQDLIRQLFLPRDQIPIRIFDFYDSEVQESYDTLHNVEKCG